MQPTSNGGSRYALGIVDDYRVKCNVCIHTEKSEVTQRIIEYKARSENASGFGVVNARLDGTDENDSHDLHTYCRNTRIRLEYSPPYALQRNELADRFMQELAMCCSVLLID